MRSIIGTIKLQRWGGRDNDDLEAVSEETFDATAEILRMPLEKIKALRDCTPDTDSIGLRYHPWDGPHDVYIEDAIQALFEDYGAEHVRDITEKMLRNVRADFEMLPLQTFELTVRRIAVMDKTVTHKARTAGEALLAVRETAGDLSDFNTRTAEYEVELNATTPQ